VGEKEKKGKHGLFIISGEFNCFYRSQHFLYENQLAEAPLCQHLTSIPSTENRIVHTLLLLLSVKGARRFCQQLGGLLLDVHYLVHNIFARICLSTTKK
jgi:hypothetical protein